MLWLQGLTLPREARQARLSPGYYGNRGSLPFSDPRNQTHEGRRRFFRIVSGWSVSKGSGCHSNSFDHFHPYLSGHSHEIGMVIGCYGN